jgi:hypothetical protein
MVVAYSILPPSTLLPLAPRTMLIRASEIKDDREREIAINDVTKSIKANYPQFFRQEKQNEIID